MRRTPVWIRRSTALALHDVLIRDFGGLPGCRDLGLVDLTIDLPRFSWEENRRLGLRDLAARYAQVCCRRRPFQDGNKRTAFLLAGLFLERNGLKLRVDEAEAVVLTLALASGRLSVDEYAEWLRMTRRSW